MHDNMANKVELKSNPENASGMPVNFACGAELKHFSKLARFFFIFVLILNCFLSAPFDLSGVSATESVETTSGVDVIIALDCSGSMQRTDREMYLVDGAKLLLDQFDKSVSRYGIVMFDGEVRDVLPLQSLTDNTLINNTKKQISQKYGQDGKNTDTVRAIARALQELEQNPSKNRQMIVLFTDGHDEPVRSLEELNNERDYVVSRCAELGIPIYTIGLDYGDAGLMSPDSVGILKNVSESTGAKSYKISKSEEIAETILSVYSDFTFSQSGSVIQGTFSGEPQDFFITVPDPYMLYVNMNVLSNSVIDVRVFDPYGAEVTDTDKVYIGLIQGRYITIQIIQPSKGGWTVTMTGEKGLQYNIDFVYLYTLLINQKAADPDGGPDYSSGNARIEARLATETGDVTDTDIYKNVESVTFDVADSFGTSRMYTGKLENDCFTVDISDLPEGDYEVTAHLQHKYFTRDSFDALKITLPETKAVIATTAPTAAPASVQISQDDGNPFFIILIIAIILLIIAAAFFSFKAVGSKGDPIKREFEIIIYNSGGVVESFNTGGYFYDRIIRSVELSEIMRYYNVNTGSPKADAICGDILLSGRKNGIIIKTKRKDLTITSSDGKIDGYPALLANAGGGYIAVDFKDTNSTTVKLT